MPSRRSGRVLARTISVLALAAVAVLFFGDNRTAQAQSAPAVNAYDARAFRSIVQTDDLLIIFRYELPQQTTAYPTPVSGTPEAWCAWLTIQAGCGSNPVVPTAPASLQYGTLSAWLTLCNITLPQTGCIGSGTSTGTLYSQQKPPRIWHTIGGFYLSAGHGITWGSSSVNACVESTTDFSAVTNDCVPVSFNGEANTQTAQRTQLASDLLAMLQDVQTARNLGPNQYVQNNLITAAGRVLSLEAYTYMDRVVPAAFQASALASVATPYSGTPAAAVVLSTQIAATYAASNFLHLSSAGSDWGISAGFMSTIIWILLGLGMGSAVYVWSDRNIPMFVIAFGATTMIGMFTGGPTISVVAVVIVIFAMLGGWWFLSRVPT